MKKLFVVFIALLFLSSCEIEYKDNLRYYHPLGWEHHHHPDHHEHYDHGWHHDAHGNEVRHDEGHH